MFIRLTGSRTYGELRGSFTASSSEGGFWQGDFIAIQLTTGAGDVIDPDAGADPVSFTPTEIDLLPEPTEYLDPEGNWSAQQESGVKKSFAIRYQRNTILMVQNKPFIWQWWL